VWFSVANLFMISVFWSLMVDLFSPAQATRLFPVITAGGSLGAIAGSVVTHALARQLDLPGLLLAAAGGFAVVILLVHLLIREKERLRRLHDPVQPTTLDHDLGGSALEGFVRLFRTAILRHQALFMLLMTWVATIAYFLQTDVIARSFTDIPSRTRAIADMDLVVNICSAGVLIFGLSRFVRRYGVTAGLVASPLLMVLAFLALLASPTLLVIQATQILRRVTQYSIARPSRELCFTVVEQESRYRAKNVIDTLVYRLGDLSAAWVQAGLRAAGSGIGGIVALGIAACALWGQAAVALGRRYERLRGAPAATL